MTTFDLVEVQNFVADLDARMNHGQNGEGSVRVALDAIFRDHASLCHEFTEQVRSWRLAVFSGRTEFNHEVESVLLAEGTRLAVRSEDLRAREREVGLAEPISEVHGEFQAAVDRMNQLMDRWVRPRLSVGPGPRHWQHVTPQMIEEARRRVEALPPLPANWPFTEEQKRALGL